MKEVVCHSIHGQDFYEGFAQAFKLLPATNHGFSSDVHTVYGCHRSSPFTNDRRDCGGMSEVMPFAITD